MHVGVLKLLKIRYFIISLALYKLMMMSGRQFIKVIETMPLKDVYWRLLSFYSRMCKNFNATDFTETWNTCLVNVCHVICQVHILIREI